MNVFNSTGRTLHTGTRIALEYWVWLLLLPLSVTAQGTLQGKIVQTTREPLPLATITLFDQKDTTQLLKGTLADSTGAFVLKEIKPGRFLVKCTSIGYHTYRVSVETTPAHPDLNLGEITLQAASQLLSAIEVIAQKQAVQATSRGIVVNTQAMLSQSNGTTLDLLRNTPTIVVDAEGNLSLRGKQPLILLNGRNSSLTNLNTIPASSIESIEIITSPSAAYDAEAENGIVNIILKKGTENGTNGAFALGAGYGAKGRVNSSALLNHKSGKWNMGLAYDNRFAGRTRKAIGDRINFALPDQYYLTQRRQDERHERNQNLRLNLDYQNARNHIAIESIATLYQQDNYETLFSTFQTSDNSFASRNRRYSQELAREKGAEVALNYERKFRKENQKLFVNAVTSFNLARENTDITTQGLSENGLPEDSPLLQRTHYYEHTNITSFKTDYVYSMGKSSWAVGYKGILRFLKDDFQSQRQLGDEFVTNSAASGLLTFGEQIHAAYLLYKAYTGTAENPVFDFDFGLRAEQTLNTIRLVSSQVRVENQYLKLFPSVNVTYHLTEGKTIEFTYGKRINRPGLGQLNPFTDITDSLTQRSGNPGLQPETVHSVELGYKQELARLSLSSKLFYRYGIGSILSFTSLRPNGVLFTSLINAGPTQTYGQEAIVSYTPHPAWSGSLSFSLFEQQIQVSNAQIGNAQIGNAQIGNAQIQTVSRMLSWNMKSINDFSVWKGGNFQLTGIYNSPTATAQGSRIAMYAVDVAIQQKLWKDRGRLGIIVTDIFNMQQNGFTWNTSEFNFKRTFKVDTRAILVTLGYTFGTHFKEKLMENKFLND